MEQSHLRGMGWLPDIPSVKDYTETTPEIAGLLAKTRLNQKIAGSTSTKSGRSVSAGSAAVTAIAASVDLRSHFSPIEDQGQLGSCTANAAVALVEYFEKRACGHHIDASRLFVYKVSRNLLGWKGDTGAYLRTAMGALAMFGAPPERFWPYDGSSPNSNLRFDQEPTAFCYAFAANYQSIRYHRLDTTKTTPAALLQKIKTYLAAGLPSMFGFPVYDEFMQLNAKNQAPYPSPHSHLYGGHAIVAVGYDDSVNINGDKGALLIRNSWGTDWGDKGYAWLSYRYVTEGLALDWWSVIKDKWVDSGQFM